MENDESKSAAEFELRPWLTDNDVYPGNEKIQSLVFNLFHRASEEEEPEDDMIPLDEFDLDALSISKGIIGPTENLKWKRSVNKR